MANKAECSCNKEPIVVSRTCCICKISWDQQLTVQDMKDRCPFHGVRYFMAPMYYCQKCDPNNPKIECICNIEPIVVIRICSMCTTTWYQQLTEEDMKNECPYHGLKYVMAPRYYCNDCYTDIHTDE